MSWSYRPALDGLRSVAVYLVLLFHAGMSFAGGGFIGVDLFFVLSGFLVTNVILHEIDQNGRLSLGRFYARRVRRLLPAALVVITATALTSLLVFPAARRLPLVIDAQSALLYFANWNFLAKENDYFATGVDESPFLHFWSLAIEEQFYVVFPVMMLLLTRAGRRAGTMLAVLVGLCAASVAMQIYWSQRDVSWAYYGTDARFYQLMAGAILAVLMRNRGAGPQGRGSTALTFLGLGGILLLGSGLLELSPSVRGMGAAVCSVAAIGGLMLSDHGIFGRLLSRPTIVYLGKISYGTYLWHWPVILMIEYFVAPRPLVIAVLAGAVSTGLAALSYEVLEHPVRTSAVLRRFRWRTVLVGVTTSAVVAIAVIPPVLESERRPQLADVGGTSSAAASVGATGGVTAKERNAPVPVDIDVEALRRREPDEPQCTSVDPTACTLVQGDGPHIVLVGDSHGRMMKPVFKALARQHDFTFSQNVIEACAWPSDLELARLNDERREECLRQRRVWYDEVLPQMDADVVVLTQMHRGVTSEGFPGGGEMSRVGGSDETTPELMYNTINDTVTEIESKGPRVLIIESMLGTGGPDPLDCLGTANRLYQCQVSLPAAPPQSDAFYEVAAALSDRVFTVNFNKLLCEGAPQCLPVVDGTVVWKDSNHFSKPYLLSRRDRLWKAILGTGVLDGLS